jgi:hypothetical protein
MEWLQRHIVYRTRVGTVKSQLRSIHGAAVAVLSALLYVVSQRSRKIVTRVYRQPYGGREEVRTGFWWGNPRKNDHLEDPDVDGRII